MDPVTYDAWYKTPRGKWIGNLEFDLLMRMLQPTAGASLLDVGSGTGYFSRRFAAAGLTVTAIDPDPAMADYAHAQVATISYVRASAIALPLRDGSFDHVCAITSLCFVTQPAAALHEMWRVARRSVILGLLNRHSLLYLLKRERGGYRGARWDSAEDARRWTLGLQPTPRIDLRSVVFVPTGGCAARRIEPLIPDTLPWGGFLALCLRKP